MRCECQRSRYQNDGRSFKFGGGGDISEMGGDGRAYLCGRRHLAAARYGSDGQAIDSGIDGTNITNIINRNIG